MLLCASSIIVPFSHWECHERVNDCGAHNACEHWSSCVLCDNPFFVLFVVRVYLLPQLSHRIATSVGAGTHVHHPLIFFLSHALRCLLRTCLNTHSVAHSILNPFTNITHTCTIINRFEELCSDLLSRAKVPVENALRDAKLSMNDINEVCVCCGF